MRLLRLPFRCYDGVWIALTTALWLAAPSAVGQTEPVATPQAAVADEEATLAKRQQVIRDRLQRLEGSMLKLASLLAENEPEKAERLRDALQYSGSRRLKAQLREAVELLEADQLSEADQRQEVVVKDLEALLALLTSPMNDVERSRAERQRLEYLKRTIRALVDDQTKLLQRTQEAGQMAAQQEGETETVDETLRELEQLQREVQQQAEGVGREMGKSAEPEREAPGKPQVGRATRQMDGAAEALGESRPDEAQDRQREAIEQLQQALDELDDALRQVRREESEETLAALEARFRNMLLRERQVLEAIKQLDQKGAANWTRVEQLQIAETTQTQQAVHEDCRTTLRILLDEGTTVIVPELLRQMADDMSEVTVRLEGLDTSTRTQLVLEDIIGLLEEMLRAVEEKREEDARLEQEGEQPPSGDGARPLLPGSAELKLLRGSQLRLNERTQSLAGMAAGEARRARTLNQLARRQRQLADLALRMNERK